MISIKFLCGSRLLCRKSCQILKGKSASITTNSTFLAATSPLTNETKHLDNKQWKISAAVSVERLPTITPALTEIEEKLQNLFQELENEQSLKSDHEMRIIEEIDLAQQKKAGIALPPEKAMMLQRTASDDIDYWTREAKGFVPASRKTKEDEINDLKSLNRALDKSLFLVIQDKENADSWTLPKMINSNGESLRETAEKALQTFCGENFKAQVIGNAPFIHYNLKYSPENRETYEVHGEKVFIFKAFFQEGSLPETTKSKQCEDFKWLKREELLETVENRLKIPLNTILYNDQEE